MKSKKTFFAGKAARIFRNIQRITESTDDRIFVLYGLGHLFLLKNYLEASQKYNVIPVLDYLNQRISEQTYFQIN
ncbi:MAG: DUF5694 domain-containing protein [Melioribacteraceae bacterium]|nr:DUF5694 domain-containing protein [Melioribacteraceae bacterium]MCF8354149.1 DUF5694 domain-containing protein [Melioribacteraceae bacterium]MCF8393376.1 DUF5694 domain-containing protein [Melioribacteraceae bacterium]MCF8418941.1 DUF5694 domain-containing protein [Melioribacteraceae bacterium]